MTDWRDDWVRVTSHAADRWHERTDSPGIGPRGAYIEGTPVPDGSHEFNADEVRHHRPSGTLLLRRGDRLVTVVRETADQLLAPV